MQIAAREMVWGGKPIKKWWLCFTAVQDNSTVSKAFPSSQTYETSTNGMSWRPYTSGAKITLSKKGNKVYFRAGEGGNTTVATGSTTSYRFVMSGKIAASGNVMSLLNGEEETEVITETYAFAYLFYHCYDSLVSAPKLPATTLTDYCYSNIFNSCSSLTQAPELPATTLANDCYEYMFSGCTSLTQAPELPATTLVGSCYYYMFEGCTSLINAPELPATTLANDCYYRMFSGCTSIVNAHDLPATLLATHCYSGMFAGCTSLTQAPKLPATKMADYCYSAMFYGCTSLARAPELPAETFADHCYYNMFQRCTNLRSVKVKFKTFDDANVSAETGGWLNGVSPEGVFECYSDLGTNETIARGTSACPEGWTVVNEKSVTEYRTIDTEDVHSFEWTPTGFIDYIDNYAITVPSTVIADILVVGGGGAGATPGNTTTSAFFGGAGGGGAGGMIEAQSVYLEAGSYDIIVGRGGISPATEGKGGSGKPSKILLSGLTKYEAFGGGGGGIKSAGESGGSGGGGSRTGNGGAAIQPTSIYGGYGNSGGKGGHIQAGGGGGGAGGVGGDTTANNAGGIGGEGKTSIITGAEVYYAAGGGGGTYANLAAASKCALGGSGIGGNGAYGASTEKVPATSGKQNTGSGGGGGCYGQAGGSGGSGIVIIRIHKVMPDKPKAAYEFSYDGESHLLYEGGRGVTITKDGVEVSEIAVKDVGTYNYTVTLKDGYKWDDLTENKMISVTVTVSVPSIQ